MQNTAQQRLENSSGTQSPPTRAKKFGRLVLPAMLLAASTATTPAFAAVGPPTVPDLIAADDSGVSNTDNVTNAARPTFTGKGIPFAVVQFYLGEGSNAYIVGKAVVSPSGQWSFTMPYKLSEGATVVSARQTFNGVQSTMSSPLIVMIDTVSPSAPYQPQMLPRHDHGSSNSDNITNVTAPTFQNNTPQTQGTDGNHFISLYNISTSKTAPIGTAAVASDGTWKCPLSSSFSTGTHTYLIVAQARDKAGNVSSFSNATSVVIDTDRPAAASLPDLIPSDDSGASNTDNITKVTTPTFKSQTESGGKIELYSAGISPTLLGSSGADSNGTATIKASKGLMGSYIYAQSFDKAGNEALESSPTLAVTIDTQAPTALAKPTLLPQSDSGVVGDGITNIKKPIVGGYSQDVNDVFVLFIGGVAYNGNAPAKVGPSTHLWSVATPIVANGVHNLNVIATDLAGNSSISPDSQVTLDTTPSAAPSVPDLLSTDDTGISNTDNATNKTALTFTGTSQPLLNIALYNNGVPLVETKADAQGKWKATATSVKSGSLHITATAFDSAGNASASSAQLVGMLDLTLPESNLTTPSTLFAKNMNVMAGTSIDSAANGDASGVAKVTLGITRLNNNLNWSGSTWVSAVTPLPLTVVNGKWSKSNGLPLLGTNTLTQVQDGNYKITLVTVDKAGNTSTKTSVLTIDNLAPTTIVTSPAQNAELLGTFTIIGTASDNVGVTQVKVSLQIKRNNVTYYWNGTAFTTAATSFNAILTNAGNKNVAWICDSQMPTPNDLDPGLYLIYASAYDANGNHKSSPARSFSVIADENKKVTQTAVFDSPSGGSS